MERAYLVTDQPEGGSEHIRAGADEVQVIRVRSVADIHGNGAKHPPVVVIDARGGKSPDVIAENIKKVHTLGTSPILLREEGDREKLQTPASGCFAVVSTVEEVGSRVSVLLRSLTAGHR